MRVNRLALLTTACAAALAGCSGEVKTASYCYSTDDSGFLLDSVRPEPGYVCVSTLIAEKRSALDSVRPEPAMSTNGNVRSEPADSVRPEPATSVNATPTGAIGRSIKLQVMKEAELKRH